jgi:hypothetical protein
MSGYYDTGRCSDEEREGNLVIRVRINTYPHLFPRPAPVQSVEELLFSELYLVSIAVSWDSDAGLFSCL